MKGSSFKVWALLPVLIVTFKTAETHLLSHGTPNVLVPKIYCPDPEFYCDEGQTCCHLAIGYGCCPMAEATCCKDGTHCCPHGTQCNLKIGACTRSYGWFQAIAEVPSAKVALRSSQVKTPNPLALVASLSMPDCGSNHVQCQDGSTCCPQGNTCCVNTSGAFACCPVSNGVCCSTLDKCCPEGYTCTGNPSSSCELIER